MTAATAHDKRNSFTAFSGTGDIPEDFAAVTALRAGDGDRSGHESTPVRQRGRLIVLLCLLALCLLLAWRQFGATVTDRVASLWRMPDLRLPETLIPEGPILDRPIRSARIDTPLSRLRENEIRAILAGHLDGGFFSLDVSALKGELEQHSWVRQAAVRRVWPDELVVSVQEHRPIARWGDGALINLQGQRFGEGDLRDAVTLPRLQGPEGTAERVMQQYQHISQRLQPTGLRVAGLERDDRGNWRVELNEGLTLRLGREDLAERLQRFVILYRQQWHSEGRVPEYVDLRYDNGLAARFARPAGEAVASVAGRGANE